MREKIEQFVLAWERKATADMFLAERLHPRIRIKLIEGLTSIFEQEMEERGADPEAEQMAALKAKLATKPVKKGKAA